MKRAEAQRARAANRQPRTLFEIDYLLMVDDDARQGALRFAEEQGGPFLAVGKAARIPLLVELPKLLAASDNVLDDTDTDADLRLLLGPGSSLGGARPKASVREQGGQLAIAKFPRKTDETNVVLWEALALSLAAKAGISVPEWRIEIVAGRSVLLLQRFDRTGGRRIPYISAMSMLNASGNEARSYLEIVDVIRQQSAATAEDMRQLWRRVVFTVLISNTDDHLRNHGFLYAGEQGWRLAPAFDLNPTSTDIKPRVLSTAIDTDDTTASLEIAREVAEYFDVPPKDAKRIVGEVGKAVSGWKAAAQAFGLSRREIDRTATAFEHKDMQAALQGA